MSDDAIAELERQLDPNLSANQKIIASCDRAWRNEKLMERLNFRGYLVFGTLIASSLFLKELLIAIGIENLWVRVAIGTFALLTAGWAFFALLRSGWGSALLHDRPS